jgi:hypothetical protein
LSNENRPHKYSPTFLYLPIGKVFPISRIFISESEGSLTRIELDSLKTLFYAKKKRAAKDFAAHPKSIIQTILPSVVIFVIVRDCTRTAATAETTAITAARTDCVTIRIANGIAVRADVVGAEINGGRRHVSRSGNGEREIATATRTYRRIRQVPVRISKRTRRTTASISYRIRRTTASISYRIRRTTASILMAIATSATVTSTATRVLKKSTHNTIPPMYP